MSREIIGNSEIQSAHLELIQIFSVLKKQLLGIGFNNPSEFETFFEVIVTYREMLESFYFDHAEELGDDFTTTIDGSDSERPGQYAILMDLLRKGHVNHYGKIDVAPHETAVLSHIFMTVLHGDTSTTDSITNLLTSESTSVQYSMRTFFTFYLSQLLREISDIQQDANVAGVVENTQSLIGNTFKLLSFDINDKKHDNDAGNDAAYETIESIFQHIAVIDPAYQGNIYLGYDRVNNTIQSITEKHRIKKNIEDGDESERLQEPERKKEDIIYTSPASLTILTKEEQNITSIIEEKILQAWESYYTPKIALHKSEDQKTIAEKRNEKLFHKTFASIKQQLLGLPSDIMLKEIDAAARKLIWPIASKHSNKYLRAFYLKSLKGVKGSVEISEKISSDVFSHVWINPEHAHDQRKRKDKKVSHYEVTDKLLDETRKAQLKLLEPEIHYLFGSHFDFSGTAYKILFHDFLFDEDRYAKVAHFLFMWHTTLHDAETRDRVFALVDKLFEMDDFLRDTKNELFSMADIPNAKEHLIAMEKEHMQNYQRELFTEENMKEICFDTINAITRNLGNWRANDERSHSILEKTLNNADAIFRMLIQEKGLDPQILTEAYQQFYCYQTAQGRHHESLLTQLWIIVHTLHIPLTINYADLLISLQDMYDNYMNRRIFLPGEKPSKFYEQFAKDFGLPLVIRKPQTLEDHYTTQIHTPKKMESVDYIGEDYQYRVENYEDDINRISNTQRKLKEHGSLLLPEHAASLDIRDYNNIAKESQVDMDIVVPISAGLPKLRFVMRGFWKEDGTMEGNYILAYNPQSEQLELTFDTTLRAHQYISEQYAILAANILGGGYATINKGAQHIQLDSYMPGALHEPRIISVVAFKNAYKQLLPDAKIIIGDDGMQNIAHHFGKDHIDEEETLAPENPDDLPF